jgi:hypothetical protein
MVGGEIPRVAQGLIERGFSRVEMSFYLNNRHVAALKDNHIGTPRISRQLILQNRHISTGANVSCCQFAALML